MAQSLHQIYGHIVFSTKDRKELITNEFESDLYKYICGTVKNLNGFVLAINGMPDHLHIIFRASKHVTDIDFIKQIKAGSSKWISTKTNQDFQWQKGYGWFSVGAKDIQAAIQYVENQKEHHKVMSFQDELRKILTSYKIDYDEKYLWD